MDAFEAIADPVRREILELLNVSPQTAGRIASHFSISRPAISRHLRVLLEAGLVVAEPVGRERTYVLVPETLGLIEQWLNRFQDPWRSRLDALETEVHRTKRERRVNQKQEKSA